MPPHFEQKLNVTNYTTLPAVFNLGRQEDLFLEFSSEEASISVQYGQPFGVCWTFLHVCLVNTNLSNFLIFLSSVWKTLWWCSDLLDYLASNKLYVSRVCISTLLETLIENTGWRESDKERFLTDVSADDGSLTFWILTLLS